MRNTILVSLLAFFVSFTSFATPAQFDAESFRQALKLKKDFYLKDGSFSGGDRTSSDFRVDNVRFAVNPAGYDRFVIDLSGNDLGEKASISRPPFYIVEVNSTTKLVNVTLYGRPKVDFQSSETTKAARKSKLISQIDFIPLVNEDRWMWSIQTQVPVKVEVFELSNPARIIIDLKK